MSLFSLWHRTWRGMALPNLCRGISSSVSTSMGQGVTNESQQEPSQVSTCGKAVGMLSGRPGQPFLANVPLVMLGLDEETRQYRAVSLLRWEDVVADPTFRRWFHQQHLPIRQPPPSSSSSRRSTARQRQNRLQRRHGSKQPSQADACQLDDTSSGNATCSGSSSSPATVKQPGDTSSGNAACSGGPSALHRWKEAWGGGGGHGAQGQGSNSTNSTNSRLPLRCSNPAVPTHGPSHVPGGGSAVGSWSAVGSVDEPGEQEDRHTALVVPVEALDGMDEQAQQAIARWAAQRWAEEEEEEEEEEGEESDYDWEGAEQAARALTPRHLIGSGVPFSTPYSSGSLVFGYWRKAPLG